MSDPADSAPRQPDAPLDVAGAYDRWAASYDADRNATRDLDAAIVQRSPLGIEGSDVLELGCGTGKNTLWIAERARSVVAMDFSAGMLAQARARIAAERVRFVQHDIRDEWPVPDDSVDVVIGNLVLEHIADLEPVYVEAERVLRHGGRLFLCELHPERQRHGGQAHFTDHASGGTVHVPAHCHSTAEFINGGIAAGLTLRHLGEWIEDGVSADTSPRILSVLFRKE